MTTRAHEIIRSTVVWDNHACMPFRATDQSFLPQLERYRQEGYTVVSLNAGFDLTDVESNFRMLSSYRSWVKSHPDELILIESYDDIRRAKETGRLGICFDLEGLATLGGQLDLIDLYYDLGVRWSLIAYNKTNAVGGGCQDEDCGLTDFGRKVVSHMEQVGMVVCCSHTGWQTAREVLEVATKPVIFSHSNAYEIFPHWRNIPDDLIKGCAATGGVIGINGLSRFIGKTDSGHDNSTAALFRHLDHIVQLVGPEHAGLGLDFVFDTDELLAFYKARPDLYPPEFGYSKPTPMVEPERLTELVDMMLERDYGEEAIRAILGGNLERVAQKVWKSPVSA
jgi:membrane dipeptidase